MEKILARLSLREKIGQMLMFDFRKWQNSNEDKQSDYHVMSDEVRGMIRKHKLGNVILFAENFDNVEQVTRLNAAFQDSVENDIPMLIGVDQEGGRVVRMSHGCSLPGNMALSASGSVENAYTAGLITGKELAAVGINVDFAPSVDINNNPNNPVINVRSYSSDQNITAEYGTAMAKGLQAAGVAATAKHFPGHGNTNVDSHTGLPAIFSTYEELMDFEVVPFADAIKNGCMMIMSGHIQFPNIEKASVISKQDKKEMTLPATLSKVFLTDILRDQLGFKGVLITDSMQMQAISSHIGSELANVLAINAGVDMLLMCTSLRSLKDDDKLGKLIDNIVTAVEDGRIPMSRIDESVMRILNVKKALGLFDAPKTSVEEKVAAALKEVGCEANRAAERMICTEGVTVLNNNGVLPISTEGKKTAVFAAYANKVNAFKLALARLESEGKLSGVDYTPYIYANKKVLDDEAKAIIDSCDNIIIETETEANMAHANWYISFPRAVCDYAKSVGKKVVVVSAFMPYDAGIYRDADGLVLCYCAKPVPGAVVADINSTLAYGANIPAAFEVILGKAKAKGRLTIDVPEMDENGKFDLNAVVYPIGSGMDLN
ncbi:MAG: beta-hexosaminidase [Clostridia bacterium]|nr:beta-hexosaminidase [Clostridia bacterium]